MYWADKQQTSWVIAPWWLCVSPWRICITFVWPSGSKKLPAPFSWSERHLHFALIRLCLILLFIISKKVKRANNKRIWFKLLVSVYPTNKTVIWIFWIYQNLEFQLVSLKNTAFAKTFILSGTHPNISASVQERFLSKMVKVVPIGVLSKYVIQKRICKDFDSVVYLLITGMWMGSEHTNRILILKHRLFN